MAKVLTLSEEGYVVEQNIALGGFTAISGTLNFDFGTKESDTVVMTVSDLNLTIANFKGFNFIPQNTSSTFVDDFFLNGLGFNIENIIDNVSFDIRATARNNASGIYQINYKITY